MDIVPTAVYRINSMPMMPPPQPNGRPPPTLHQVPQVVTTAVRALARDPRHVLPLETLNLMLTSDDFQPGPRPNRFSEANGQWLFKETKSLHHKRRGGGNAALNADTWKHSGGMAVAQDLPVDRPVIRRRYGSVVVAGSSASDTLLYKFRRYNILLPGTTLGASGRLAESKEVVMFHVVLAAKVKSSAREIAQVSRKRKQSEASNSRSDTGSAHDGRLDPWMERHGEGDAGGLPQRWHSSGIPYSGGNTMSTATITEAVAVAMRCAGWQRQRRRRQCRRQSKLRRRQSTVRGWICWSPTKEKGMRFGLHKAESISVV